MWKCIKQFIYTLFYIDKKPGFYLVGIKSRVTSSETKYLRILEGKQEKKILRNKTIRKSFKMVSVGEEKFKMAGYQLEWIIKGMKNKYLNLKWMAGGDEEDKKRKNM